MDPNMISSYIRSMKICFVNNPNMNPLQVNEQLQFLGWNDIEVDYHTIQLAIACFETEDRMMELHQERRNNKERRFGIGRRRINPPKYTGIEKRNDPECRSGNDRRKGPESWSELQPRHV